MALQGVIFDKDGVLVDSERGKCEAMKRALVSFGHENLPGFEDWFFGRVGTPGLESSEYCVRKFGLHEVNARVLYDKTEEIRRGMIETEPAPIIVSSVSFLKSLPLARLKIGVASSDFPNNIRIQMTQAGVLEHITAMTSGEKRSGEVTRDKPHPDVYLVTAEKLSIDPKYCIGIEDTDVGIQAVKSAGMYCIGFRNPSSGKQTYSQADRVTGDLTRIPVDELFRAFS